MIKKILWWAAGVDIAVLSQLETEHKRYSSIGAFIIFTGFISSILSYNAFSALLNNNISSVLVSLIFGLLVFSINRTLIQNSSSNVKNSFTEFMLQNIFAILFCIGISVTLAHFISIKIFENEIQEYQISQWSDIIESEDKAFDDQIEKVRVSIESLEKDRDNYAARIADIRNTYSIFLKEKTISENTDSTSQIVNIDYQRTILEELRGLEYNLEILTQEKSNLQQYLKALIEQKSDKSSRLVQLGGATLASQIGTLLKIEQVNGDVWKVKYFLILIIFLVYITPYVIRNYGRTNLYEAVIGRNHNQLLGDLEIKSSYDKEADNFVRNKKEQNSKKVVNTSESDLNSITGIRYESYFRNQLLFLNSTIENISKKSNNLLLVGIVVILIGIILYLAMIIFWLDEFRVNGFKEYHVFGLISTSLLFLFIEFLGAWFLKQHRRLSEESIYMIKIKAVIEKNFLAYLLIKEESPDDQPKLRQLLLDFHREELKFPGKNDVPYSSFATESMSTISNLTDSIKRLSQKG